MWNVFTRFWLNSIKWFMYCTGWKTCWYLWMFPSRRDGLSRDRFSPSRPCMQSNHLCRTHCPENILTSKRKEALHFQTYASFNTCHIGYSAVDLARNRRIIWMLQPLERNCLTRMALLCRSRVSSHVVSSRLSSQLSEYGKNLIKYLDATRIVARLSPGTLFDRVGSSDKATKLGDLTNGALCTPRGVHHPPKKASDTRSVTDCWFLEKCDQEDSHRSIALWASLSLPGSAWRQAPLVEPSDVGMTF